MATDQTLQININLNAVKGGTRAATQQTVDRTMDNMKTLIMDNVVLLVTKQREAALRNNLEKTFSGIVTKELARMGRQINQYITGIKDNANVTSRGRSGPRGNLSVVGPQSLAMRGQLDPVSLASGTGPWPARSPRYLKEKRRKYGHTKWFKNTGILAAKLRDPATYLQSYGPVRVAYIPAKKGTAVPSFVGVSNIKSGIGGPQGRRVTMGRVEVSVLGRITRDMLGNPGTVQPSAWNTGLFGALPQDVEAKLLNREELYRPFLEHFLSYYLTRSIPNAVFRRIEAIMQTAPRSSVQLS